MNSKPSAADRTALPASERRDLAKMIHGIVLAQGNVYIKELLRSKGIRIGATKADFEENFLEAIEDGKLTRADVEAWLDSVEGWGDQHVYLYRVPSKIAQDSLWDSPSRITAKLKAAHLGHLWNARTSLEFPETRKLTGIYCDESSLRFTWHEGQIDWVRTPDRDRQEQWEGDRYELRSYRERRSRSVMRFVMQRKQRLAAVFLQIPYQSDEHETALAEVTRVVQPLIDMSSLDPFSTASAIVNLDQQELSLAGRTDGVVKAQKTRLSDAGTYIEFASTSGDGAYKNSTAVRRVRLALKAKEFSGDSGIFTYCPDGQSRKVRIELAGSSRRIRLWAQLTAPEVWMILELLADHE